MDRMKIIANDDNYKLSAKIIIVMNIPLIIRNFDQPMTILYDNYYNITT